MKIFLERSGGFAGLKRKAAVDADSLEPQERQRLEELVAASGFFGLPEDLGSGGGADRFQYRITVDAHTVSGGEGSLPEELRPLIDWLETHFPRKDTQSR